MLKLGKTLGRYIPREEYLTIQGVTTKKSTEDITIPNPFLFLPGLFEGRPAAEQHRSYTSVIVSAANKDGEMFGGRYDFADQSGAQRFESVLKECERDGSPVPMIARKGKLPWYLKHIL